MRKKTKLSLLCLALIAGMLLFGPWTGTVSAQGPTPGLPPQQPGPQPAPSASAISPVLTEFGRISLSIDGQGTNEASGIIQVEKPAGATVRGAYLAATTTPNAGALNDGDIKIEGQNVAWSAQVASSIGTSNHWADVTAIVAPIVDAASAGRVDLEVAEVNATSTDGEILVVIFDDPNQTSDNTVILLFGAQNSTGDTFAIGLAEPLDLSNPDLVLDLSLGISFGYQSNSVQQYSEVDVNDVRLTTSAGGQDDGAGANGALLTVGGLDDSHDNPSDPSALPTDPRSDDELYNLKPFVSDGDTSINVFTKNPSNDDNIFFSSLFLGGVTAVVGEGVVLSPSSATACVAESHTLTAAVQDDDGNPVVGREVTFNVTSGPHAGTEGKVDTNSDGNAIFIYTGTTFGTDTIEATFVDSNNETIRSNSVSMVWQNCTPPDLSISKDDGQTTINPGDTLIYTITANNTSATNATGVTISDILPAHTTFVSASDGGSEASGVVTWNVGALNGGASVSRTVTVQVNDPLPDDVEEITNSASINDDGNNGVDPTPANNTDSDVDEVQKDATSCDVNFNATLEWEWTTGPVLPESNQVTMTPMVMDMNADGSADILFITHLDKDLHKNAHLRVVNGHDGSEIFTISDEQYDLHGGSQLAVGDIDLDGKPEILAISELDELIAFEHDGTFKWRSDPMVESNPDLSVDQAAPSIADLDQDGTPEIVVGHYAFDNTGDVLWVGEKGRGDHRWGPLSMVLDLDLDGEPEVLAGNSAYHANGDLYWHYNAAADGFTSIGNLDDDPNPEILLITYGKIRALEHDGTLKWNLVEFPGVGSGGAPVVGDMDGDGQVEIGVANNEYYMLYEADGTLKWQTSINSNNSGVESSSLFDFDGDGAPEILYSDHLNLYIFNGSNGAILWQTQSTSRGGYEYPVVADVDDDGRAELIMSSNNKVQPAIGGNHGIQVYGHESWPSTRAVWNQYSYHINNVNDNGSIPQNESNSWQEHNTYHLNPSDGCGEPPDGTTLILDPPTETMRVSETITIDAIVNDVIDLRSVQFKVEFNADVLEIVDADPDTAGLQITPGSCPQSDMVVVNQADNGTGVVEYAVTSFNASCSPNGVVAQMAFHAHAEGKGWIKFTSWGLSNSLGQPITVNDTQDSSIVVEDEPKGSASGTVRLVGREIHRDTGQPYHNGATIKVIDASNTVMATATTNAAGEYELIDLPAGTYTVRAEMDLYLYAERPLVVEADQTTALPHLNMWSGDNNGDDKVNIVDLQPLFQLFDAGESFSAGMTCASPPTWNPSTEALQAKLDFNADCEVNVGDMALHSTTISAFFAGNGANAPVGPNVPVVPVTPGSQAVAPTPWE